MRQRLLASWGDALTRWRHDLQMILYGSLQQQRLQPQVVTIRRR